MRLRPNEFCPIHKSLSCCGRETLPKPRLVRLAYSESMIHLTREDIGKSGLRPRCGSSSTGRSSSKTGNVPSVTKSSPTTTTLCQTIRTPKEWEGPGGTIIRTISRPYIGGVTKRKGPAELMDDGRFCRRCRNCQNPPACCPGTRTSAPRPVIFPFCSPMVSWSAYLPGLQPRGWCDARSAAAPSIAEP